MSHDGYIRHYDRWSYEIAPKVPPYQKDIELYRGDEISITLKGVILDGNMTPFNFDIYDEFNWCFRRHEDDTEQYCADSGNIVLGQSSDAITYDKNQGNPAGTTQDELHLVDEQYDILSDYESDRVVSDVEGIITGSTVETFMKFNIKIIKDVSR